MFVKEGHSGSGTNPGNRVFLGVQNDRRKSIVERRQGNGRFSLELLGGDVDVQLDEIVEEVEVSAGLGLDGPLIDIDDLGAERGSCTGGEPREYPNRKHECDFFMISHFHIFLLNLESDSTYSYYVEASFLTSGRCG